MPPGSGLVWATCGRRRRLGGLAKVLVEGHFRLEGGIHVGALGAGPPLHQHVAEPHEQGDQHHDQQQSDHVRRLARYRTPAGVRVVEASTEQEFTELLHEIPSLSTELLKQLSARLRNAMHSNHFDDSSYS